jgi:metal-responsive CopG/Arc/MetJ family transcriptional regulator
MKMATKSDVVTVRLLPSQAAEVDRIATKYGQSRSELVREALQIWLGMQWKKEQEADNAVAQNL